MPNDTLAAPPVPGTPTSSSPSGGGPDRLRAKAEELRGTKPGAKRGPYKPRGESSAAPGAPVVPPSGPLFTPDNTGRLLRIPFDLMAIKTDCAGWQLSPQEQTELCATATPCLNEWVTVSPKWVALSLFSMSLIGVVSSKVLGYTAYLKALELEKLKLSRGAAPETKPGEPKGTGAPEAPPAAKNDPARTSPLGPMREIRA